MGTPFPEAILRGEDRLLEQIVAYAEANGILRFAPRGPEAWRPVVRGISGSLLQAFRGSTDPPSLAAEELGSDDGLTAFVVAEARRFRLAGMPLGVFLGLGKIFRLSYDDFVRSQGYPEGEEARCRLYVERFFDRNEIASCVTWAAESGFEHAEELLRRHDDLALFHDLVATAKTEWQGAIDRIDDMLLLEDAGGNLQRCNRAFQEFTGRPYRQILRRPCGRVLQEAGLPAELPGAEPVERFHEATGKWFVLNRYPAAGGPGGAAGGAVITVRDVSGMKQAIRDLERRHERVGAALSEQQRRHAENLRREKEEAIGRLAAGVANDLHRPAGLIASNLNTLGKYLGRIQEILSEQAACIEAGAPGALVEAVRRKCEQGRLEYVLRDVEELIGETAEGAENIRSVAADLKRFSRKDAESFSAVDLNACVRDAVGRIRQDLEEKAALRTEFGKLPKTRCCAPELTRALRSLLVHALEARTTRGAVTVRTWPEAGFVCVAITDPGRAIPGERLERIFDPYFGARAAGQGNGLDLSIARDILEKHHGEILARSGPGDGTTFTLRIPVVEEA